MKPVISLVTGTYQRLPFLRAMIGSFRANIPRGIAYEVIVVDGGSTDGTLEWCQQQADVKLIEQGELLGAIPAFDAGAEAATGDYVLLANDDISFEPLSIVPALIHLEQNARVGAVAFADNRPAPGYEKNIFKVQEMTVNWQGRAVQLPYAQVGLFRKWLGDAAGWWGSKDPLFQGHTYGGDNYLSARIYELGYTIAVLLDTARVHDKVAPDTLRERNHEIEKKSPGRYYQRFPHPPKLAAQPQLPNPQAERLRVLYLPIYEKGYPHHQQMKRGLREALQRIGLVYEIDYVSTRYNLARAVQDFRPHLMLTQCHAANSIPVETLAGARAVAPEMVVVNWNGDVYERHLISDAMLAYLRHFDLQLVVNASVLDYYHKSGIPAAYWQVAFEPVNEDALPDVPAHEVVFLANAYSDERRQLGLILQSMPGINTGIYGKGWRWSNGDTTYDFPSGTALYRSCKIAIGDNQYPDQHGFVSNRIFESLASGAFLLHQTIHDLEDLTGLKDGLHYVSWSDVEDMQHKIRYWLNPRNEAQRKAIAAAGCAFVREHHNFDVRVRELLGLLEKIGQHEPA